MTKLEAISDDLIKAVKRLEDVLKKEKDEFIRDSAIQRFEIAFDLAWKTIKAFLEERKKVRCASPVDCFREAYQQGLIDYDEEWIKIAELRNQTVHTYKESLAEEVYSKLPEVLGRFQQLVKNLEEK